MKPIVTACGDDTSTQTIPHIAKACKLRYRATKRNWNVPKSKPEAKEFKRNSPKETEHTAQSKRVKMRKGWGLGKESAEGKPQGEGNTAFL